MHLKKIAITFGLALTMAAAQAHTKLQMSVPAEGSKLSTSPTSLMLHFSEATQITALTIQKDSAAAQPLTPLPKEASDKIMMPLAKLAPGNYAVSWRAVGDDNHVMNGKLHFSVTATEAKEHGADHHQ